MGNRPVALSRPGGFAFGGWHPDAVLLRWIREVADEPLLIDPAHRDLESRENTWSLSLAPEKHGSSSAHEVVAAFEECASVLRERVRSLEYDGPVTFYVWHDQQAGQLRCSTASLPEDELPFGARVELVSLHSIAEEFLDDEVPGLVRRADLRPASDDEAEETGPAEFVVRVWTTHLDKTQ
ncbi:hypothetical protein [Amycolatopsis dendrobii]|uniref:Uncharacterized protein n=1 Tax=Amycolatopsis dendrobii TaxID=2760662 RepID=A0A7W3VZ24_9PSEU|nr:hypothetical protein [Amycolatopsis dendrobii]MBB1155871.1 hypothetical protein [Amycolatopsis dendrobii]